MGVFEKQLKDGTFEWDDRQDNDRIWDPSWWKVSPVRCAVAVTPSPVPGAQLPSCRAAVLP